MNNVNKTLYIPLYGKAHISKKSLFLKDEKAEEIWEAEQFPLKGKSKSKWLAYYMGIRSAVFDDWLKQQIEITEDAVILHLGCGMDSRILRIGEDHPMWYDIDFPEVIEERKRYYTETENYRMLSRDIRKDEWLSDIPKTTKAIVLMEGVSMYLSFSELKNMLSLLCDHFGDVSVLMDCYTVFAAKMSKYKNPINDVGVTEVFGIDNPCSLQGKGLLYVQEHTMIPARYVDELRGMEKKIFRRLYAGNFAKKLYKLFEFRKFEDDLF